MGPSNLDPLRDPDRLRILRDTQLLDGPDQGALARLTRFAARLLRAPVTLVNLVTERGQLSVSCVVPPGWPEEREASLEDSFCKYAVIEREPIAIEDTREDPRVSSSSMVTELGIRSYLGIPLVTSKGHALGTLCVSDFQPRRWSEEEVELLTELAASAVVELELRLESTTRRRTEAALRRAHDELEGRVEERTAELAHANEELSATLNALRQSEERVRLIVESVTDYGIMMLDPEGRILAWNTGAALITGYAPEEALGRHFSLLFTPEEAAAGAPAEELAEAREHGRAVREGWRVRKDGTRYWSRQVVTPIRVDGELVGFAKIAHDLTERRARQQALERERQFVAALLESLQEAIVACDAEGRLTLFNRAARELHGLPPEALPFDRHPEHYDLYLPDGETRMRKEDIPLYRALQGEVVRDVEMVIRPRTGAPPRTLLASGRAIHGADGEKLGAVVAMYDITERKVSEERARLLAGEQAARAEAEEARQRTQAILDSISDPFLVLDHEERLTYINRAAETLFEGHRSGILGKRLADLYPDLERTPQYRVLRRVLEERRAEEIEAVSGMQPGRWYYYRFYPVEDGVAVYAKDVTQRKSTEQALRESEERFRQLAAGVREVFWMFDPDYTRALYVSPVYQRIFGRPTETLLRDARSCLEAVVPEHRERALRFMLGLRNGPASEVVQIVRPDGESRWIKLQGFPVYDDEGVVIRVAGTSEDITEERQAEEALLAAKEQAERANRAKSEFLSRMSHELRTPLNAILGFGQLLEADVKTEDDRESVEQILRAGRHLLSLIDEVLDLAKIEAGRISLSLEPVRVDLVVEESVQLVRTLAAERSVSLSVNCEEGRFVRADRQRLRQVMLNLLSNAIKYNRPEGSVRVHCRGVGPETIRIEVHDTGRGIPADRMERLFNPFERLGAERQNVEGTGLGLALSRGLVRAMNGDIGVESAPGVGTSFWVDLPITAPLDEPEGSTPAPHDDEPEQSPTYRVLYVEDNIANLRLIERILERRADVALSAAMQGSLGLQLARELAPDLILLDVHLPDISGEEVMRRLKADPDLREIPVVVISADATERNRDALLGAGAAEYLTKPIDVSALLRTLEAHLPEDGSPDR